MAGEYSKASLLALLPALLLVLTASSLPAHAQNTAADFSKGSIQLGYDNSTCDASLEGALRYNNGRPPSCPDIGDQCSGGEYDQLYYIGEVAGNHTYAAPDDESGTYEWGGWGNNADADSTTDGLANTDWLVDSSPDSHPAAEACRARGAEWYLPAQDELHLMWVMVDTYGVTARLETGPGGLYWSSTELGIQNAMLQNLNDGGLSIGDKMAASRLVRCVRQIGGGSSCPVEFCDGTAWQPWCDGN